MTALAPPAPPGPMRRMRRIGYAVLGLQLTGFLIWSAIIYGHFAVTSDFATYNQPWFLVAHGNFDPYSTVSRIPFWQNDAEFMPWALAPFYWLFRGGVGLMWLQDLSIAGAEAAAFAWICDIAAQRCRQKDAVPLAALGLVLLVADPWTWWAVSFDVHEEVLVIAFVVLLIRDTARGRRRAWAWAIPVLLGGAPTSSYVIGAGLGGVLASRRTRALGVWLALAGTGYSLLIIAVHGDLGVPLSRHFGYLASATGSVPANMAFSGLVKGIASHPLNIVRAVWSKRPDVIANLATAGLLGLCAPVLMPLLVIVVMTNTLASGVEFAEPMFQSIPVYVLMPVGTAAVIAWLLQRHRRVAIALSGILAAQALGWAAAWGPATPGQWLRIPGSAAGTLAGIEARIPASAEVIASQGVMGRFSDRALLYGVYGAGNLPVQRPTWFVLTPDEGVELASPAVTKALAGELAGPLHAALVTHANGVWAFVWNPPSSTHSVSVPSNLTPLLPAWTSAGAAGAAIMTGPEATWHVAATGAQGYVVDQLEWQAPPGRYVASGSLSASGPVNVEVWNDTSNVLLARQTLVPTDGIETITMPVNAAKPYQETGYSGWGPFRAQFVPPPAGERLEVRVWSPGGTAVNVYRAGLRPAPAAAP